MGFIHASRTGLRAVGGSIVAAPALVLGASAAAAATGPTLFPHEGTISKLGIVVSGVGGIAAGAALHGVAGAAGRLLPGGGRLGGYVALAGVGAAIAGAAHLSAPGDPRGGTAKMATYGTIAAAAGAAGVVAALARSRVPGAYAWLTAPALAGVVGGGVLLSAANDRRADRGRSYTLPEVGLPKVDPGVPLLDNEPAPAALHASMPGVEPGSVAWEKLPGSGRRFLWQRTTTAEIERVMGKPALNDPRRIYVGLDEAPDALDEPGFLDRKLGRDDPVREPKQIEWLANKAFERMLQSGAFERSNILVTPTTSTGFINPMVPLTFEMSTLGDSAIVGVQAGHKKAVLEMRNLDRAAAVHERLLEKIRDHIVTMPVDRRPEVNVYGESFGAWTSQLVLAGTGLGRMNELGVSRVMFTGSPYDSTWPQDMQADQRLTAGHHPVVVAVRSGVDAQRISATLASDTRVTLLKHDADPVALFNTGIFTERPEWLPTDGSRRPEGISGNQRFWPVVTGIATAVDQQNAQSFKSGTIESKGHDYRSEISYVMRRAYGFNDVSDQQVARMREYGRQLELRYAASPPPAA